MSNHKIKLQHLEKAAYVYIRQSSCGQLKNHRESREMQYGLQDKARDLGFRNVVVLDQDLGISAKGLKDRPDFERLVTDVSKGMVGIIFCIEAPRLARNGPDWARMFQICGLLGTLIADGDGIYDLAEPNDRLIIGIKGTLSEVELQTMKQRLNGGRTNKAKRCALFSRVPIGYVRVGKERIRQNPDERIRKSVALIFEKFNQMRTGLKVYKWFTENQVSFPRQIHVEGEINIEWKPILYSGILEILRNPTYAGAYCFGKTKQTIEVENGELVSRQRRVNPEDALVLRKDQHKGYIDWAEFKRNRKIMQENNKSLGSKGSPQRGQALLQGLLRCQRCGFKLRVRYGGKGGKMSRYNCQDRADKGSGCFSFGGSQLEEAVANQALETSTPLAVAASIRAMQNYQRRLDERREILELEIREAKYEADRAARAFHSVEPENRNVSTVLASEWDQALQKQYDLKDKQEALERQIQPLPQEAQQTLDALAVDLPRLWHHHTTTSEMKKHILRALIEEIWVDFDETKSIIKATIEWQGGACTQLAVPKRRRGQRDDQTQIDTVTLIKQLAEQLADEKIVSVLNRMGLKTGQGNTWTPDRLRASRSYHHIPVYDPLRPRTSVTLEEAARRLEISTRQLRNLIEKGIIKAGQVLPSAPWAIKTSELDKDSTRAVVDHIRKARGDGQKYSPWTDFQKPLFED